MLRRLSSTFKVSVAMMFAVLSSGVLQVAPAFATPAGNNGTLKIMDAGSQSEFPDNEPKVCSWFYEGFYFDPTQAGYIEVDGQGQTTYGPVVVADVVAGADGYFKSGLQSLPDGHYKATLYEKPVGENGGKSKSKVFKVECSNPTPPQPDDVCPNIDGPQAGIPRGMIFDRQGNCVLPFLETSHSTEVCGQATISFRNASPWLYRVLIEEKNSQGDWVRVASSSPASSWEVVPGVMMIDNRGEATDDRTGTYTVQYGEDSGVRELRYKVSSGTEADLYASLPVGQFTSVFVDTNCITDSEIPLPSGFEGVCGLANDTVPLGGQHYTVISDTDWQQDGNDPRKVVRTIIYTATPGYVFPMSDGWIVSTDGKTASYTYTDQGASCAVVCEEDLTTVHATNLSLNGWTLGNGASFIDDGMLLHVSGGWNTSTVTRSMSGNLSSLGSEIDFAPNQDFLGLHVKTSAGTLVYEKYYENQDAANAGKWWSVDNFGVASGMGYATFDTLENIIRENPGVALESLTVLYTNSVMASSTVEWVKIGCQKYTFDLVHTGTPGMGGGPVEQPRSDTVKEVPATVPIPARAPRPVMLPETGAVNRLSAAWIALSGVLTYGVMFYAVSRRQDA